MERAGVEKPPQLTEGMGRRESAVPGRHVSVCIPRDRTARPSTDDPAVIVIQFRLAFLGSSPSLHAAFRRECVLHTPLFAGFPGFRSKLWADDVRTGVYAGVYEWQGAERARHYAERMVGLLAPFSNTGTARYHVIEHGRRDDFLACPRQAPANGPAPWWQPSSPVAPC